MGKSISARELFKEKPIHNMESVKLMPPANKSKISKSARRGVLKKKSGFVLIFSMVFAFVILSALGFWHKEALLRSFLAKHLIEQRALYIEARSLIPLLLSKLDGLAPDKLEKEQEVFMEVKDPDETRWEIKRFNMPGGKVRFNFKFMKGKSRPHTLGLTVKYTTDDN